MPENSESGSKETDKNQEPAFERKTVADILGELRDNKDAQKEVFGRELSEEEFEKKLKAGASAAEMVRAFKALGYELPPAEMVKEWISKGHKPETGKTSEKRYLEWDSEKREYYLAEEPKGFGDGERVV
jgi:aminoglycoside phosphotransferase (APT) family kinase protein